MHTSHGQFYQNFITSINFYEGNCIIAWQWSASWVLILCKDSFVSCRCKDHASIQVSLAGVCWTLDQLQMSSDIWK